MKSLLNLFCTAILLFAFSIVTEKANSQFVITYDQLIHPGDSLSHTQLDTINFGVGNSGPNVLWDYSNINILQLNYQTIYFQAGLPTACPSYPANIVWGSSTSWPSPPEYHYTHYLSDSTQFSFLGRCEFIPFIGSHYLKYTDPYAYAVAPLSYLDTFTDSISGIDLWGINLEDSTIIEGHTDFFYDAYGELRLPWGIYSNVARVKKVAFMKDTVITSQNGPGPGSVKISMWISYEWYDLNSRGWIFTYSEGSTIDIPVNGQANTTFFKGVYAQTNLSTGINSDIGPEIRIGIYPNPSTGKFTLQFSSLQNSIAPLKITVCNLLGETLYQEFLSNILDLHNLDLSYLDKGIYIVTLTNTENTYSNKVMIK